MGIPQRVLLSPAFESLQATVFGSLSTPPPKKMVIARRYLDSTPRVSASRRAFQSLDQQACIVHSTSRPRYKARHVHFEIRKIHVLSITLQILKRADADMSQLAY